MGFSASGLLGPLAVEVDDLGWLLLDHHHLEGSEEGLYQSVSFYLRAELDFLTSYFQVLSAPLTWDLVEKVAISLGLEAYLAVW